MKDKRVGQIVKTALGTIVGRDPNTIHDTDTIFFDLGLESIDFVDLIFELEQVLKIEIEINEFIENAEARTGQRHQDFSVSILTDQVVLYADRQV